MGRRLHWSRALESSAELAFPRRGPSHPPIGSTYFQPELKSGIGGLDIHSPNQPSFERRKHGLRRGVEAKLVANFSRQPQLPRSPAPVRKAESDHLPPDDCFE